MGILHENIQFMLQFLKASGPTIFLPYINDLPDDVICNIAIYADDTTFYSKCDYTSDLWQQLELASDTVDWAESSLLISVLQNSNGFI